MSEIDVKDLKKELHLRAYKNVKYMLSLMNKESFDKTMFCYVFVPFLSYGIRDKINTIYNNGDGSGLGGWQMFKPTLGLDEEAKHYNVKYVDNGWYKIWIGDCADTVMVKIKYAGKYLNPIIVGVKNDKMQIAVADDNYDAKTDSKMMGCTPYDDEYMFFEFMCPLLHASVSPGKLVEEKDFINYIKKINATKLSFVQKFYTCLVQSGNDIRKVQKKFHNSLVWHFMNMIDIQKESGNYDNGMFLPCSYADFTNCYYTITYLGKDWYQVTSSNGGGQNVQLKVVLYGKKLTPAIVGMRNLQKGIDYCPARFEWHENN